MFLKEYIAQCKRTEELIKRRRNQMMFHSHLYYDLSHTILKDHEWDNWAKELMRLQHDYGWRICYYDGLFKDWSDATGHHLPVTPGQARFARHCIKTGKATR